LQNHTFGRESFLKISFLISGNPFYFNTEE